MARGPRSKTALAGFRAGNATHKADGIFMSFGCLRMCSLLFVPIRSALPDQSNSKIPTTEWVAEPNLDKLEMDREPRLTQWEETRNAINAVEVTMRKSSALQTRNEWAIHNIYRLLYFLLVVLIWPQSAYPQGTNITPLATFTKPSTFPQEYFGNSVAALGNSLVLVGCDQSNKGAAAAGAAFLFHTNGTLLTTITNPTPESSDQFGCSVAALGNDHVLIGASSDNTGATDSGAAYLFNASGSLQTTFTNPTPANGDLFGAVVVALGNDRVLIGAPGDLFSIGSAYLFSANGSLLAVLENPTKDPGDNFGSSLASAGDAHALVGARYDGTGVAKIGVAYLFNTNGVLTTTFTNPTPVSIEEFGSSVAGFGSGRVLIGAIGASSDRFGMVRPGEAYLFSTNGTLLTTFTNPAPGHFDAFGSAVAQVGNDKVLIGAGLDDTGGMDTGSAFLFSTNGALLATFIRNPATASGGSFGNAVASLGADRVLIGARTDNIQSLGSGAAYLFSIPYPPLSIARNASTVSVRWVSSESELFLQESGLLGDSSVWSSVTESVSANGPTNVVQQPLGTTNRFYRLRRQ